MIDGEHVLFDDELVRLGLVTEYEHPLLGRTRQFGNLVSFGDTPGVQDRPTPRLGEDTRELLGRLGYDEAAMQDLHDRAVVTWPGDDYPFRV
jgi:crotonobetainyl-CoA:carnitine CoA-transferase CaiB-like acyl-CoA transferase